MLLLNDKKSIISLFLVQGHNQVPVTLCQNLAVLVLGQPFTLFHRFEILVSRPHAEIIPGFYDVLINEFQLLGQML